MGCNFEVTVVASGQPEADAYIELAKSEIVRIEKLISSWDEASETSLINRNAGREPVKVSSELIQLIERSLAISKLTDGAFDISYASMDKIWQFDGSMKEIPSKNEIQKSIALIGYQDIVSIGDTVLNQSGRVLEVISIFMLFTYFAAYLKARAIYFSFFPGVETPGFTPLPLCGI